jgi:hypothetical protein
MFAGIGFQLVALHGLVEHGLSAMGAFLFLLFRRADVVARVNISMAANCCPFSLLLVGKS